MATQTRTAFTPPDRMQILLDPQSGDAVFQLARGAAEVPLQAARCGLVELGLPEKLVGFNSIDEQRLDVPQTVLSQLRAAVEKFGVGEGVLWLEFPSPRGPLYMLPWERLLAPLGHFMLRLPSTTMRAQMGQTLQVALCVTADPLASSGDGRDVSTIVAGLLDSYFKSGSPVRVHLFFANPSPDLTRRIPTRRIFHHYSPYVDSPYVVVVHDPPGAAEDAVSRHSPYVDSPYVVVVHDPPGAAEDAVSRPGISNPWLQWMCSQSEIGRPFDWVHIVGPGCLTGDRGALALATTPFQDQAGQAQCPVSASELNSFLSHVGAWGVVLSGPGDGSSGVGLRELCDAITQARPGVAVHHCLSEDQPFSEFTKVIDAILPGGRSSGLPARSISCWVHPLFVGSSETAVGSRLPIRGLDRGPADMGEHDDLSTASWRAAVERVLESQQMRWMPDGPRDADEASVVALRNVTDLVRQHLSGLHGEQATSPDQGSGA